jgi:hypothetical protein
MAKEIEQALKDLRNASVAWTARRDAAALLGRVVQEAFSALKSQRDDPQIDVRMAVDQALRRAGTPPVANTDGDKLPKIMREYSLEELAQSCVKQGKCTLSKQGNDFALEVRTSDSRRQIVQLSVLTEPGASTLLRIHTRCGEAAPKTFQWALRNNARMKGCAFALETIDEKEHLTVVINLPLKNILPELVQSAGANVAQYGDWVEQKLSKMDRY